MNVTKSRFLNRHGFGVHSPWAYDFIINVIEERLPYYAYDDLYEHWKRAPQELPQYEDRDDELLFRLVNALHPSFILEVGTGAGVSTGYLASVSSKTPCVTLDAKHPLEKRVRRNLAKFSNVDYRVGNVPDLLDAVLSEGHKLDFVLIAHTAFTEQVYERLLPCLNENSIVVIERVTTKPKKALWKKIEADARTGVTFMKGSTGLIFYDLKKYPHRYVL